MQSVDLECTTLLKGDDYMNKMWVWVTVKVRKGRVDNYFPAENSTQPHANLITPN